MNDIDHAAGLRRERIQGSPNFVDGVVQNILATPKMDQPFAPRNIGGMLQTMTEYLDHSVERVPRDAPPVVPPDVAAIAARPDGLQVTWLGHSTMLVAIDGALFLTDPVFSDRVSPVQWAGPKRFHAPPLSIDALPPVDAVVLSHDHFDHLDRAAVIALARRGFRFVVPLGVGGVLEAFGIPAERFDELDWWEHVEIAGVQVHAAPARHFSGRGLASRNRTLWTSMAFIGPHHKAWFSGDTGPFDDGVAEIARRFGTFDLAMIETGAWHPSWGEIHLGPQQAVRLHGILGARAMMPVHWGTFSLALHAWDEPVIHVQELMDRTGGTLFAPVAGQTFRHDVPLVADAWRERWRRWRQASPDVDQMVPLG